MKYATGKARSLALETAVTVVANGTGTLRFKTSSAVGEP